MTITKELTNAIERLGDELGVISELATSIYNEIKKIKKEPMHDSYICKIKRNLTTAEYYYTKFHSNIFENL